MNATRFPSLALASAVAALALGGCDRKPDAITRAEQVRDAGVGPGMAETRAIAEEAYIYGFPMIVAYKALYQLNVDRSSSQYQGPFNHIHSDARVFTYKDTAVVTPNSDTPYSMLQADLRAEPLVLCVPEVEKKRYYSVQFADLYSQTYGYVGTRATGNGAGCYLLAGPGWKGEAPAGIKMVLRSETLFSLVIFRTQLFGAADIAKVKKIQAGYRVQPLSAFLKQPAPPPAPAIQWLPFTEDLFKTNFAAALDFLLRFCPEPPEEKAVRARLASIGIGPGKTFDFQELDVVRKAELGLGVRDGYEKIEKQRDAIGKNIDGWQVGAAFGDRAFYHGNYLLRAASALAGIYGNIAEEAMYPMTRSDVAGKPLDGGKHAYTLTFAAGQFPPVNAFWSVTLYDGRTQLLIKNPINRYLVNSPMLPGLVRNKDGSLTIAIQKTSPGKAKESNWLPAPDGPIYLVMRLYWPKTQPPSILPPGSGTWKPPGVVLVK